MACHEGVVGSCRDGMPIVPAPACRPTASPGGSTANRANRVTGVGGGVDDVGEVVGGIDGCRAGWLVVRARPDPLVVTSVTVEPDLTDVLDDLRQQRLAALAIDMPIGLGNDGPRACDVEARAALGPRRSSVFPAPVRAVLGARDHEDALRRSRAASGVGLSLQSWHLMPRIAELDDALASIARRRGDARVHETHPELAFAVLDGAPMGHPKRTAAGRRERLGVLRGRVPPRWLRPAAVPRGAAPDDVLDAVVLAVRAAQWRTGERPPEEFGDGSVDARGRPMTIRG